MKSLSLFIAVIQINQAFLISIKIIIIKEAYYCSIHSVSRLLKYQSFSNNYCLILLYLH